MEKVTRDDSCVDIKEVKIGRLLLLKNQLNDEILELRERAIYIGKKLEGINCFSDKGNSQAPIASPISLLDEIQTLVNELREVNDIMKSNVEHIETII